MSEKLKKRIQFKRSCWICYSSIFLFDSGWVNTFLSWEGFEPLARLSYNIYLVHMTMMNIFLGWQTFTVSLSDLYSVSSFNWGEPLWLSGKVVKNEKINETKRTRVRSPPRATSFLIKKEFYLKIPFWHYVHSNVDIQINNRQNVEKMAQNVDFNWSSLTAPRHGLGDSQHK
jgi:hypothetical protein